VAGRTARRRRLLLLLLTLIISITITMMTMMCGVQQVRRRRAHVQPLTDHCTDHCTSAVSPKPL